MSSIDQRIVQMQFENSKFEKNANESLKTIEKLNKELQMEQATKSLKDLQKAGDSFSLAKVADEVTNLGERFSVLGVIGKRVLENLVDETYGKLSSFVKSVSVDQITSGFSKYEDKTRSVQTIVNATGLSIEEVDKELSKLAWFTDETSYNFVDMVSNIGKFTSMNIPLDKSVTAMQGIATWAAASGQGVNEASRAMYNLSQAMGAGALKLMDWKSIENANMATAEFKQTAIDTAIALGTLKKGAKAAGGTEVTLKNFSQTLQKGWFTSDVLMATLEKYGEYADAVYKVASEEGITAAQAMAKVSGETMKLGEKAFKAAQEAKTFSEAIDSVKDAVSTGWMTTFEMIFGNYEEAKVLWTDLANGLWDVFASGAEIRNDLLRSWKELGGRKDLLQGVYDIFHSLYGILLAVKDAFASVFPPVTVDNLLNISSAVKEFGEEMKHLFFYSENSAKVFKKLPGFLGDLKLGDRSEEVKKLQDVLVELGELEEQSANGIFNIQTQKALERFQKENNLAINGIFDENTYNALKKRTLSIGETIKDGLKIGDKGDDVAELQKKLNELGANLAEDGIFGPKTEAALKKYQETQGIFASGIIDKDTIDKMFPKKEQSELLESVHEWIYYGEALEKIKTIATGVASAFHIVVTVLGFVGKVIGHIVTLCGPLIDAFVTISAAVAEAITSFDEWLQSSGKLDEWFGKVKTFLEPFGNWVKQASESLLGFFGLNKNAKKGSKDMMTFAKLTENIKNAIDKTGIKEKILKSYEKFKSRIKVTSSVLKAYWKQLKTSLGEKFKELIAGIPDKLASITEAIGNFVADGLEWITPFISKIPFYVQKLKDFWASLTNEGDATSGKKPGFLIRIRDAFRSVVEYLFGSEDELGNKKLGLFSRIGKLLSGDLEGFTEGFDEEKKNWILSKIESIKNTFSAIKAALSLLFTGDETGADIIPEGVRNVITTVRNSLGDFFESVGYLFSGEFLKDSKFTKEQKDNLKNVREWILKKIEELKETISKIKEAIGILFSGVVSKDTKLDKNAINKIIGFRDWAITALKSFGDSFKKVWNAIKYLFGYEINDGVLSEDAIKRLSEFKTKIVTLITNVKNLFVNMWDDLRKIFSKGINIESIKNAVSLIFSNISMFFSNLGAGAKEVIKYAAIIFVLYKVVRMVSNISGAFKKLKSVIASYKKNAQPLSKTILEFAGAVGIIAASIWAIAQLDANQFRQGIIAIGAIIGSIVLFVALSALLVNKANSKIIERIGKAIWDFAKAIGTMSATIMVLSLIPWNTFLNGLAKVGIVCVLMIAVLKRLNKVASNIKLSGLIGLAVAIGILALTIGFIGKFKWSKIGKGLIGLYGVVFIMRGLIKSMGKFGSTNIKLKGLIGLSIAIGIITGIVSVLGKMSARTLAKGLGSLLIITILLRNMVKTIGKVGSPNVGGIFALIAVIGLIMAGLVIALKNIKDVDPELIISFAGSLSAIITAAGLFAKLSVGSSFAGVSAAALGLLEIISVISLVVAAFAGLSKIPGFKEFMESGAETIGSILGTLVGSFGSSLIGQFGDTMDSFSMLSDADPDSVQNAIDNATLLQKFAEGLPKKEILTKIVDSVFGSEFKQFSDDMVAFGKGFNKFAEQLNAIETTEGLDTKTDLAVSIASSINTFAQTLPSKDNVTKIVDTLFKSEFEQFSDEMTQFGTAFNKYAEQLNAIEKTEGLDTKTDLAVSIASSINTFAQTLPSKDNVTKIVDTLFKSEFEQFSDEMTQFGTAFNKYAEQLNAIETTEGLDTKTGLAVSIASSINTFAQTLPSKDNVTKIVDTLFRSEFEQFSDEMTQFGTAFNKYATELNAIDDTEGIDTKTSLAVKVASSINTFAQALPSKDNVTKIVDTLFKSEFEQFSDEMTQFGTAFNSYAAELNKIDDNEGIDSKTTLAVKVASSINTFAQQLPEKGVFDKIVDSIFGSDFDSFLTDMSDFAQNINSYANVISTIRNPARVERNTKSAIAIASSVAGFLQYLNDNSASITANKKGLAAWFSVEESLQGTVFDAIGGLAESIGASKEHFENISGSSMVRGVQSAVDVAKSVAELLAYLQSDAFSGTDFTANSLPFDALAWWFDPSDSRSLAGMLSEFGKTAEKIEGVDKVAEILSGLSGLASYLTNAEGTQTDFKQLGTDIISYIASGMIEIQSDQFSGFTTGLTTELKSHEEDYNLAGEELAFQVLFGLSSYDTSMVGLFAESMKSKLKEYYPDFEEIGENFVTGLTLGVYFKRRVAINTAGYVAQAMVDKVKSVFSEASPSKVMMEIGQYFSEGLAMGVDDKGGMAIASSRDMASSMIDATKSTFATLSELLSEDIDDTPMIRPVVDLTDARLAAGSISSLFRDQSFGVESHVMANRAVPYSSVNSRFANQNGSVGASVDVGSIVSKIDELSESIRNIQLVMDTGAVVGQMASPMDKELGAIAAKRR